MVGAKTCIICGKEFSPNKYRPNQKVCSNLECQYQRQLMNMKVWRKDNPNYFRYREAQDTSWRDACRERARKWRDEHRDYLNLYREEHKEDHKKYMREYMRLYRKKNKNHEHEETKRADINE